MDPKCVSSILAKQSVMLQYYGDIDKKNLSAL